jgi:small-conductance mechanosensitive channel
MEPVELQIIETIIAVFVYLLFRILINRSIDKMVENNNTNKTRAKIVKKAINLTALSVLLTIVFSVFGVNQSELAVFIGSLLTIMGIAFFAQWSILSNITSGIIIFFNHPIKLDDTIIIIDKDYEIEGRVSDVSLFFVILKTPNNEQITIPNNLFIQKMIKKNIAS